MALKTRGIPGAAVVVTTPDGALLSKGYGFADLKSRAPVQPDRTLFGIASVSKLFVWTAVMQLKAEGKVDLNTDVNRYLKDMQVPATFPQPITLTHLMTHTAGFEDRGIGVAVHDAERLRPLGQYLKGDLPVRVRPPGVLACYSNHGAALAGHIVEQVSGLAWDDYVEQRILKPLGMDHTTFRQPLPSGLRGDVAKGYRPGGRAFPPEYFNPGPAGCAFASAGDLGIFMRMHLNFGRLGSAQVLDEGTARRMQSVLFVPAPEVNAAAHGFYEMNLNGHRGIGHQGDLFGYHSLWVMLPEDRMGLFITFNGEGGDEAAFEVYEAFMDHYFPQKEAPPEAAPRPESQAALARFAGQYLSMRQAETTYQKLGSLVLSSPWTVVPTDDGKLRILGAGSDGARWIPTGKLTFREEHGTRRRAFREDEQGRVTHLMAGWPGAGLERVEGVKRPSFHFEMAGMWILTLAVAFVGWPAAAWVRRRAQASPDAQVLLPGRARLLGWIVAALMMLFLVEFALVMQDPDQVRFGTPPILTWSLWQLRLTAILAMVLVVQTASLWQKGQGLVGSRIGFTWVTLASCLSLWQLHYWRLLTWPF